MSKLINTNPADNSDNYLVSNSLWIILLALEALIIGFYLFYFQAIHYDEIESMHAGWKLSVGEKIYVDFYELHHPLLYYLNALIIKVFGETLASFHVSNTMIAIFAIGIIFYTYKLTIHIFNNNTARILTLLLPLAPWFTLPAFEIRPDVPMFFFGMASLYYLYRYFDNKKLCTLLTSALFLGISFLFLQKAIFLIALIGSLLLYRTIIKEIDLKVIFIYGLIILIIYCLFLLFIYIYSDISSYFFFCFEFIQARAANFTTTNLFIFIFDELINIDRLGWLIIPSFLLTIKYCDLSRQQIEIAIGAICLSASVIFTYVPYPQYYMPSTLLAIIVVAYGLAHLLDNTFRKYKNLILSGFVITGSINVCYSSHYEELDHDHQLAQIEYVIAKTDKTDYVYDGCNIFNLYRKDLDFFWFLGKNNQMTVPNYETLAELKSYKYDIYDLIDKKKPKFISPCFIDLNKHSWVLNRYRQTSEFDYLYIKYNNNTKFNFWHTFVDDLKTGSSVLPAWDFFTADGDVEVRLTKAADVNSIDSQRQYPFVGIGFNFESPVKPIDLSQSENLKITYRVSGPIHIILKQDSINVGEEFRFQLPQVDEFNELVLNWNDFYQPAWSTDKSELDLRNITGIKFQITAPEKTTVNLGIRNIEFTKHTP